jgi:hypothetical protein
MNIGWLNDSHLAAFTVCYCAWLTDFSWLDFLDMTSVELGRINFYEALGI